MGPIRVDRGLNIQHIGQGLTPATSAVPHLLPKVQKNPGTIKSAVSVFYRVFFYKHEEFTLYTHIYSQDIGLWITNQSQPSSKRYHCSNILNLAGIATFQPILQIIGKWHTGTELSGQPRVVMVVMRVDLQLSWSHFYCFQRYSNIIFGLLNGGHWMKCLNHAQEWKLLRFFSSVEAHHKYFML